jgi:transposase
VIGSRQGHQCSETTLTGESRFHIQYWTYKKKSDIAKKGFGFLPIFSGGFKGRLCCFTYFVMLSGELSHSGREKIGQSAIAVLSEETQSRTKKIGFGHFREMSRQEAGKRVKKLSLEDKARIVSWREEGVPVAIIAERLGRHQSSIKRLLVKAKSLPPRSIPARKKGSGRPAVISKDALKILERFVKKNPAATLKKTCRKSPPFRCGTSGDSWWRS